MKDLLLYKPLLGLRKVIVYLLITAIVFGLVLYFIVNSALIVRKVADTYASDYNISYSRIHGNVLTGVMIEDLAYTNQSLAKHITLKWNPAGLFKKTIIVNALQVQKANVDTIKTLIASFSSADNNESNQTSTSESLSMDVKVDHLSLTLEPFVEQGIGISSLVLDVKDLQYTSDSVSVGKVGLKVDSNVTNIVLNAKAKGDHLIGQVRFTPSKEFFELYALPVRKEAIGDIMIDVHASKERIVADLNTKVKQLLVGEKNDFNLDIDSLQSHVVYDISKGALQADTKIMLNTPYAKDILVTNLFMMDGNISYSGNIHAKQMIGMDAKFLKPLNNLHVKYEGDIKSINAEIKSDNLQGRLISDDFKKANLHLETQEAIKVSELVELPEELNQTKVNIVIDAPLNFEENATLVAYAKIRSNVVNMDANISYKDVLHVASVTHIPKESLLRPYSKELKWDSLTPITVEAKLADNDLYMVLNAATLDAKIHYDPESTKVDGKITLNGLEADIIGIVEQKINISTKTNSISSLIESVKGIYAPINVPAIKGKADVSVEINELKTVNVIVKSPELVYQADRMTEHVVNDINFELSMDESKMILKHYTLTYAGQKLFSAKPSIVSLEDGVIRIAPLWLNDQFEVQGEYDLKTKKGTINAVAKKLLIAHEIFDLDSIVDIKTVVDGNKTSVSGNVILLGGNMYYDLSQKTFASDSDIIIVQDIKEKEVTPFMDNLSASVQIKTKKPLIYKKGAVNIKATVDLNVYKAEHSELMLLGSIEILEGGSYIFEGKKFILDKSHVFFTGNPNKPLLEASVKYKSVDHLITIRVTGTADAPNINFSSKPSLTKEQILSIILFDSEGGAGTNSGEEMMKMMGGAMAKSALSDLGVQVDHLVIGVGNSVEVGKKLTDEITIIYVNDEVSSVKLKYEHSKHLESVIGVSEESQSYDIIYKKDF